MHDQIRKNMTVVGADGVNVGTVAEAGHHRITLAPPQIGAHKGHQHFISNGLVAAVEGNTVRLSANADVAITFEEEA
jgi:hypothetical protein